jgi:hydrogenase expression/formation protein HypE
VTGELGLSFSEARVVAVREDRDRRRPRSGRAGPPVAGGAVGYTAHVMAALPVGKLRADALQAWLGKIPVRDDRVVVGPRPGEDAAVIDMGDRYLLATADPITFTTDAAAWYAVHVNANDIAVRGGKPRWFLATVLLPQGGATESSVEELFRELGEACAELDVTLVGGHTEVTHGLPRPVIAGAMLGEVARDKLVTTSGARPGDALVLTKGVPVEGAAILAREKEALLLERGVRPALLRKARNFLRTPGISVVPEAEIACELAQVHAMHDATEGGVATALHELAAASGVGLRIERDRIPILREGAEICGALGIDPLGTLASGALLLALPPGDAATVIHAFAREGIDSHFIGQVLAPGQGVLLVDGAVTGPLPAFPQDEIARVLGGA